MDCALFCIKKGNYHKKTSNSALFVTLFAICIATSNSSWADVPSAMRLWKKERDAFTEMSCSPISAAEIECESNTTRLIRIGDDKTFDERWASLGYAEYFTPEGMLKQEKYAEFSFCDGPEFEFLSYVISAFEGDFDFSAYPIQIDDAEVEKAKARISKLHPVEKKDYVTGLKLMLDFCDTKALEPLYEFFKNEHQIQAKTCQITSHQVVERYKKIRENLWVYQTDPSLTPCRRFQIMTLELPVNGAPWEWTLRQEQLSLDKDAEWIGGTCGEGDGIEEYEFNSEPVFWGAIISSSNFMKHLLMRFGQPPALLKFNKS